MTIKQHFTQSLFPRAYALERRRPAGSVRSVRSAIALIVPRAESRPSVYVYRGPDSAPAVTERPGQAACRSCLSYAAPVSATCPSRAAQIQLLYRTCRSGRSCVTLIITRFSPLFHAAPVAHIPRPIVAINCANSRMLLFNDSCAPVTPNAIPVNAVCFDAAHW